MSKKQLKTVSKSVRFEVFKRDHFKCQYCGRSSPDVVLQVDHIHPKAEGGDNDILNLITSCWECNIGKGKKTLDDNAKIKKQYTELDRLAERKDQMEMMLQWKDELINFEDKMIDRLCEYWERLAPGYCLNKKGRLTVNMLYRNFGFDEVMTSMTISAQRYLKIIDDKSSYKSWEFSFNKISGICYNRKMDKEGQK